MKKWLHLVALAAVVGIAQAGVTNRSLEERFMHPPESARPWVFWHWNNGNVTKEGITKDLEAYKRVGIGGVACFRIAGHSWAPDGPLETGIDHQLPMIKWAAEEAERLGIVFALTIDYGYGSGGPHISPENSMQQLSVTKTHVTGTGAKRFAKLDSAMSSITKKVLPDRSCRKPAVAYHVPMFWNLYFYGSQICPDDDFLSERAQ